MINITLAQLKADIAPMMKGTSLRQIKDFYGTAAKAANRLTSRIDTEETRCTFQLATPFYESVRDYPMATDYKRMIAIYKQAQTRRGNMPFGQTSSSQFLNLKEPGSYSIGWNKMVRTLNVQVLPDGNCTVIDDFNGPSANGLWVASADASGLYTEPLNYIQGNGALGLNLSGATGSGIITNSTVPAALDLSADLNEDSSFLYVYIPPGTSARFTSFALVRGDSASAYRTSTVNSKADGTAFSDGWNFLLFPWASGVNTGSPTNTKNQYRVFTAAYTAGTAINGFLLDSWTNDLGTQYLMDYYSEYFFRDTSDNFKAVPTSDTDLVNVGVASYEILKTEMMIDITQEIRTGAVRAEELLDWRLMLNGTPQSRYVKDPPYHGLYQDYYQKFPSDAVVTVTRTYNFDV